MRYIPTRPYGAVRGLDRIAYLLDRAKSGDDVKIWYVLGLGLDSCIEPLRITADTRIEHLRLELLGDCVFLRNVELAYRDAARFKTDNSLPGVIDGEESHNDNYLFEDEDLANDYLKFCLQHEESIVGRAIDKALFSAIDLLLQTENDYYDSDDGNDY